MKIVFLDIDGVLNSRTYMKWWLEQYKAPCGMGGKHEQIAHESVKKLCKILDETGAKLVLSSSWRILWSIKTVSDVLIRKGLPKEHRIIAKTPGGGGRRGPQIQEWLDNNPEVESFIILDDDSDMDHLTSRLVQTSFEVGLTDNDVEIAIKLLNGNDE